MAPRIGTTPKPKKTSARKKAAEAAAKADSMVAAAGSQPKDKSPPEGAPEPAETAPAFGSNEPDEGTFLHHVQILVNKDADIAVVKEQLKGMRKERKSLRDEARAAGLVMGELDRAVKDAETEQVDLEARERRYLLYMKWLGCALDVGAPKPNPTKKADIAAATKKRWEQEGYRMGVLGKPRALPEGCPPENQQDFLRGHESGQEALMRSSRLTKDAFEPKLAEAPAAEVDEGMLTLGVEHFRAGTDIDDANLKSLLPGYLERFHNAKSVVAVIGGKRRILKDASDGYVDTGEDNVPLTDAVDVEPEPDAPAPEEPVGSFA